ncbi:hypothetical protein GX48_00416 [Paracoccidioides brasiliensis]|nr:hypothetical protein GX48_00416 [Paracoccidioides brasiliensis]
MSGAAADMEIDPNGPPRPAATTSANPSVSPYETYPEKLPQSDQFLARHTHYGRYHPSSDDFKPDHIHCHVNNDESRRYWETVLAQCNENTRMNSPAAGKRDTFALGSVIVKSDHMSTEPTGDYSVVDGNMAHAIKIAEKVLPDLQLPQIYLRAKINGRDILVQSRIPGVSLEVAWPYLTMVQKEDFKQQARNILQRIDRVRDGRSSPSYVVKGENPKEEHRLQQTEYDILFESASTSDKNLALAHNNLVTSNIIVDNDTIIGIIGWCDAGYFGWDRAKNVHCRVRCTGSSDKSSGFGGENPLPDGFWHDLYDFPVNRSDSSSLVTGNVGAKLEIKAEQPTLNLESIPGISTADNPLPTGESWTPRKITDLKRESMSRASSADRSSPVPSTKAGGTGVGAKKRAAPSSKKGTTTRKPAPKKRKLNQNDTESVDGPASPHRRSDTPVSSRASKVPTARGKKQTSLSIGSSPAPEAKKVGKAHEYQEEVDEDGEEEDLSEVFCICRKPDNHTWMIGCDGGCEDWFHGKCVNINQEDANLIDKYICPACEAKNGTHTTWKRMCRLPGCRQPARISGGTVPSKYCTDEHGREFMRQKASLSRPGSASGHPSAPNTTAADGRSSGSSVTVGRRRQKCIQRDDAKVEAANPELTKSNNRDDEEEDEFDLEADEAEVENGETEDLGSRGGVLSRSDLKAVVMGVKSAQEFRGLGDNILPPLVAEKLAISTDIDAKISASSGPKTNNILSQINDQTDLDLVAHQIQFTANERQHIQNVRDRRTQLLNQLDLLRDRDTFLSLIRQRAKTILELLRQADPKSGASAWKDICGYDSRLSWSDDEFNEWRFSDVGKKALRSGVLEAAASGVDGSGDVEMQGADAGADGTDKAVDRIVRGVCIKKRCERHRQWVKVQQQDMHHEERIAREELEKCEKDAKDAIGRVVLRLYSDEDRGELSNDIPAR